MTLVLGALTHTFVVQVSDRRITRPIDGAVLEDDRNKATIFCNLMGFAYSGLAEIQGQRTDEWLARVIAPAMTLQETHDRLAEQATTAFATLDFPPERKRHAFCGIGWAKTAWSDEPVPGQSLISNALTPSGQWLEAAAPVFTIRGVGLSATRPHRLVPPIGARLRDDLDELERNVGRCVEHGTGPFEVVRLLGKAIRRTALADQTVGRSLLAIVIPRPSESSGMIMVTTPVAPSGYEQIDHPMFFSIPAASDELVWKMPNFVCRGMLVSGTFEQGRVDAG